VARFEDLIRSPGLSRLRRPVAPALLWLSLGVLCPLIATDSGGGEPATPDWEERFRALRADMRPGEEAPRLWAHRGFHAGGAPQNSPQAVAARGVTVILTDEDLSTELPELMH